MKLDKILTYAGFFGFIVFFLLFVYAYPSYTQEIDVNLTESQIATQETLSFISILGNGLMSIFAIIFFIRNHKKAEKTLALGLTALYTVSYILASLNEGYTPGSYLKFISFYFYAASATILYKDLKPKLKLGFFNKKNFKEILMGFNLAGILLGFTIIFFYLGVNYFNVVAPTPSSFVFIAFLSPLLMAVAGAFGEEVRFRVFNILYIKKLSGSLILAVLTSSTLWALLHVGSTIVPVYTRVIELFLAGIIYSLFFLRYGIITNLVGHMVYNVTIISTTLFFEGPIIDVVIPLLILAGYYAYIKLKEQTSH